MIFFLFIFRYLFSVPLVVNDCFLFRGVFLQIIVERSPRSRAPELDKKKYLVPSDLTGETTLQIF